MSVAESAKIGEGWTFREGEGLIPDFVNGATYMHQVYTKAAPDYSGRVTIPTLWDKEQETIVNNESSEIIRMFNSAFNEAGASGPDFYPEELRAEIDALNERIYTTLNNGVYRCGFATSQDAYDEAIGPLFETLDFLEERLSSRRYLTGPRLSEADLRLWPTLARFDLAYYGNFKCNKRHIYEYENLWGFTREIYQLPGVAEVTDLPRYKTGYYSILQVNPTGIVPAGPDLDFNEAHGRGHLPADTA
jgi:putative glutathione S-transferase